MKNLIFLLLFVLPSLVPGQTIQYNASTPHTDGTPSGAPTTYGAWIRYDKTNKVLYRWTGAAWTAITGAGTVTSVDVSGGSTGLTTSGGPITASGTITLAGTLDADNGGTGFASYTVGDLLQANTTSTLAKLAAVATGNALISGGVGTVSSWGKIGLTTHVTGTLPAANGGTGIASYTIGDMLYASGATTLSKLAGVATGNAIISGGVATAPSWGKIGLTTHVSGTLPVANGGTGATTFTNDRLLTGNGTSAIVDEANATFNGTTLAVTGNKNSQLVAASLRNTNSGASAQTRLYLWNDSGTGTSQGGSFFLTSSGNASPYTSTLGIWGQSGINKIAFATNNAERMRVTTTGLHIGGTADASQALHVTGSGYITGNLGVKVSSPSVPLDVLGNALITGAANIVGTLGVASTSQYVAEFERTSGSPARIAVDNASNSGFSFKNGDAEKWVLASYVPSGTNYSFSFYNQQLTGDALFINGDDNNIGIGLNASLAARLHVKGAGATSGTSAMVVENSAGTDILNVRDDLMSAFGTTPVATEKLLVRGATSDNTAKAFVAERSSGTDIIGAQNDGKVSINNAAYTEALTVNGNTQTDMLVLTNQTASTATGKVVYDNGSGGTYSGTLSLGDGTHALVMAPTLIERHVLDYLVNWSTGRKGAFWTVPARFDGYKIAKAYISVTAVGAGAGDDELTIEIGGVGEGVQVITAGTHTLVMNDVINTDDVITFNITEISATPAQGLHVSLELSKL